MSTVRYPGPLSRLVRRHGLTRSPLHRGTDRIEAFATVLLVVLVVLMVPLSTTIARGEYQHELAAAATAAAGRTEVSAVLVTDADLQETYSNGTTTPEIIALARWQLPNGRQRLAPLPVKANHHAGDQVPIWIDRHGNRTDPPQSRGRRIANAVATGVAWMVGGWALLGTVWWIVCLLLGRINAANWDAQWARSDPGWRLRS